MERDISLQRGLILKRIDNDDITRRHVEGVPPTKELFERLRNNEKVKEYIRNADRYLEAIGYTEHGFRHAGIVSQNAYRILKELNYPHEDAILAQIAGYIHDIGNMLGRIDHHRMGALLAKEILEEEGLDIKSTARVMMAIVSHEEEGGVIFPDPVGAALLIADKSDVHRSRVRNPSNLKVDIHDRVNFSATSSELIIENNVRPRLIKLMVTIDTRLSQVIEYFEIFLTRMSASRRAASILESDFHLYINNTRMA